jgi:hypothetical protein
MHDNAHVNRAGITADSEKSFDFGLGHFGLGHAVCLTIRLSRYIGTKGMAYQMLIDSGGDPSPTSLPGLKKSYSPSSISVHANSPGSGSFPMELAHSEHGVGAGGLLCPGPRLRSSVTPVSGGARPTPSPLGGRSSAAKFSRRRRRVVGCVTGNPGRGGIALASASA